MAKDTTGDTKEVDALTLPEEDVKKVSAKYAPEGFKDQEEYLADLRETYEMDLLGDDENRRAAMDDKRFVAGEQWDPEVLQQRKGLPNLIINTIPQFTAQLVGDWRENRNAVKVLPAESGDKDIADIRSDLIRSIETKSRADRVYDSAFESMVQCGDGGFRVGVQYTSEDVFDQDIVLQPIDDALSIVWDRLSIDPTGRDADHCFVDDLVPTKEFNRRWPDAKPSDLNNKYYKDLYGRGWIDTNTVKVTEHWRMIERKRLLGLYQDGSIHVIEGSKIDEIESKHGKLVKTRMAPCKYAQMHLVTGYQILAGPFEWKLSRLPIIRMSGRVVSVGDRRVRFGLVRFMKDNVRLRNFWRSVAAEQLGYAPKAQWIAPESAVDGREDAFRKAHLTRDPLLIYNDDATAPPERLNPPEIQAAILQEAALNAQDMKDVTGIHDASLGIKSNETSGRAIMARQREGDVASLTYYDNGNAAVLEAGDVMNQLISQIYDGTRIIRIIGEDESTKFVNINDPSDPESPNLAIGLYDVAITSGPSYTTRRLEAADAMMQAVQVYPEIMQIAGDLVVKAQDWPGAEELSERLQKTIPPQFLSDKEKKEMGQEAPNMQAIMQQQGEMQQAVQQGMEKLKQLEQENQLLKLKAADQSEKLRLEAYKAETDRLEAYAAILKDDEALNLQRLEREADTAMTLVGHAKDLAMQQQDHDNTTATQAMGQAHDQNMQSADQDFQSEQAQQEPATDSTDSQP
jgi:hypothetical protein